MSIYSFYDIYNQEININSDSFDSIIFKDILTTDDITIGELNEVSVDDLRNDKVYDYTIKLKEFIDTRQDDMSKIPLNLLDRTGSKNSVLMSGTDSVIWQKLAQPVEGLIRIEDIEDDSIVLTGSTMLEGFFVNLDSCSIENGLLVSGNYKMTAKSETFSQDLFDTEWSNTKPVITENVMITDCLPEKSDMANNRISVIAKSLDLDTVEDVYLLDRTGVFSKVLEYNSKVEVRKVNDIKKAVACSKYAVSYIRNSDSQIEWWGQINADLDYQPPVPEAGYMCVNGGYYGFVGVSKDGKLYGWGNSSYTNKIIISRLPVGNDYIYADVGMNYGLALKEDKSIDFWGYESIVSSTQIPSGNNFVKVIAGERVGGALDENGQLYVFAINDYYNLLAQAPTDKVLADVDFYYQSGVYLTTDGEVGTWGSFPYAMPNLTGKNIVRVIAGKYTMHAITDVGEMISWGSSYVVNTIKEKENITDMKANDYFGVSVDTDGDISVFGWYREVEPVFSVLTKYPTNIPSIVGGEYLAGIEYDLTLSDPIVIDTDPYIVSSSLYLKEGTAGDISEYTLLPKSNITISSQTELTANITVEYGSPELFTKDLSFIIIGNNADEDITRIEFKLSKSKIGE